MNARQRRAGNGFTILEILISIVVLVLGITGIVALFPTAIGSSKATVQDTYAASIAQSVIDAVKVGLRSAKYIHNADSYFIFSHDGVLDAAPTNPAVYDDGTDKKWQKDYCILLPRIGANTTVANEPIFLYPVPNQTSGTTGSFLGASMDQRHPTKLDTPTDNFRAEYHRATTSEEQEVWVGRTYKLGRYRDGETIPATPPGLVARGIRAEFYNDDIVVAGLTSDQLVSVDPYTHYSFAMALKRARIYPGGGVATAAAPFSDRLFELRIMVYRNFNDEAADTLAPPTGSGTVSGTSIALPKTNVPIAHFVSMVAN